MKDLFIPLKGNFYDDFAAGIKRNEYRLEGARWNKRTCVVGRHVIISRGYGTKHRMRGVITAVTICKHTTLPGLLRLSLAACYKLNDREPRDIICITISDLVQV